MLFRSISTQSQPLLSRVLNKLWVGPGPVRGEFPHDARRKINQRLHPVFVPAHVLRSPRRRDQSYHILPRKSLSHIESCLGVCPVGGVELPYIRHTK